MDNVILTPPHIAGCATNGMPRIAKHVCEEIERFYTDGTLRTGVNYAYLDKMA